MKQVNHVAIDIARSNKLDKWLHGLPEKDRRRETKIATKNLARIAKFLKK